MPLEQRTCALLCRWQWSAISTDRTGAATQRLQGHCGYDRTVFLDRARDLARGRRLSNLSVKSNICGYTASMLTSDAGVSDVKEAQAGLDFAKRFEIIKGAETKNIRLQEVDLSDASSIAEALPRYYKHTFMFPCLMGSELGFACGQACESSPCCSCSLFVARSLVCMHLARWKTLILPMALGNPKLKRVLCFMMLQTPINATAEEDNTLCALPVAAQVSP